VRLCCLVSYGRSAFCSENQVQLNFYGRHSFESSGFLFQEVFAGPAVASYVIVFPSLENQGYTGCSDVPQHLFSPSVERFDAVQIDSKQEAVVEKPIHNSTKNGQSSKQTISSTLLSFQDSTVKHDPDLQLVEAFTNPKPVSLTAALKHLHRTVHQVKGDGSCLYHAVAHQAKLITTFSTGDEVISRHLRRLTLFTMLNYPAVQLESNLS